MTSARWVGISLLCMVGCLPADLGVFMPITTDRYTFPQNHIPAELVEEHALTSADGVTLAAVLALQPTSALRPTAVYLHGQASNIDVAWPDVQLLWDAGYNVVVVDYRGYGKSAGEPSEGGLYLDAAAAFDFARRDPRLDPSRLVIWGHSLGAAVASHLALEAPAVLLVMMAPFTSMTDMVELSSPYAIPADWNTDAEFDTLSRIGSVWIPVVVAHGSEDRRVPPWMAEEVFRAANEPKRSVMVSGAGHDDVLERGLVATLSASADLAPSAVP